MKSALNNDQIAGWLRKAADDLFDAAQSLVGFESKAERQSWKKIFWNDSSASRNRAGRLRCQ